MTLKVVLEASEEGGYTAYIPSLPGCISEGDTLDEAMENIREAVELYLEPIEDDLANFRRDRDPRAGRLSKVPSLDKSSWPFLR